MEENLMSEVNVEAVEVDIEAEVSDFEDNNIEKADLSEENEEDENGSEKRRILPPIVCEILSWVMWIGGAVLLALLINNSIIVNAQVISGSMEQTIMTGDRVFGMRTSYWFGSPSRFDVIVFNNPTVGPEYHPGAIRRMTVFVTNIFRRQANMVVYPDPYVKRIIGMPGERLEIRNGRIYIDGYFLEGDVFARGVPAYINFNEVEIPEGHFFVLGDNRGQSSDSRHWGFLAEEEIIGRIRFTFRWDRGPRFNTMR